MSDFRNFEVESASEILAWAIESYGDSFAIATSFQKEGMVILDLASRISASVRVFTLDTGRLPDETYHMMESVRQRYGIPVEIVFPERDQVEHLVAFHGPNLFYSSVQARQPAVAALLVHRGASLDRVDAVGQSARQMARAINDPDLLRALGMDP